MSGDDDSKYDGVFATAMPSDEAEREKLRTQLDGPLSAKVPNAIDMPCTKCGMLLTIGPFLQRKLQEQPTIILRCYACLPQGQWKIDHLGNPDSRMESAWDHD